MAGILGPLLICLWYVVNIHFQKNLRGGGGGGAAGNVKFPILGENGQISGAVTNCRQCGECDNWTPHPLSWDPGDYRQWPAGSAIVIIVIIMMVIIMIIIIIIIIIIICSGTQLTIDRHLEEASSSSQLISSSSARMSQTIQSTIFPSSRCTRIILDNYSRKLF